MTMLQEENKKAYSNVEHECTNIEYDRETNFEDGALAIECGKLDKAEKIFNEMIGYNPEDFEAINKLGIVYAKKKDFMLAREYFEQALGIKEDFGPAFVNIGNTYKECEDNVHAKMFYELAIANDPKYHLSYYNLAIIHKANGDYDKYMKYLREYKNMYKLSIDRQKYTIKKRLKNKKNYKWVILIFLVFILFIYLT